MIHSDKDNNIIGDTMNNSGNPTTNTSNSVSMMGSWKHSPYMVCPKCHGEGRFIQRSKHKGNKHARRDGQNHCFHHENNDSQQQQQQSLSSIEQHFFYKPCQSCQGSGLAKSTFLNNDKIPTSHALPSSKSSSPSSLPSPLPSVAIIGGGIGGLALGIALWHRQIPFVIYERDGTFLQRKQGYGLTLQQASKALNGFGEHVSNTILPSLTRKPNNTKSTLDENDESSHYQNNGCIGIISTRHVVYTSNGTIVGEWGLRKWGRKRRQTNSKKDDRDDNPKEEQTTTSTLLPPPKRQNVHVARQALRYQLLQALPQSSPLSSSQSSSCVLQWDRRLVNMTETDHGVDLVFISTTSNGNNKNKNGEIVKVTADIVVGADGIRSTVRSLLLGNGDENVHDDKTKTTTPLRYLGCIVILGICPLNQIQVPTQDQEPHDKNVDDKAHDNLLDGHTVFQTADGTTRLYAMPYSKTDYMWQLSYPVQQEADAKQMSRQGEQFLKDAAWNKCSTWHAPIPQLLQATPKDMISGYPVYDRDLLKQNVLQSKAKRITLMGDAAHPMSPFKGQGANQALLDALSLARALYRHCGNTNRKRDSKDDAISASTLKTTDCIAAALEEYHTEMLDRSATKVQASADAAQFLHSNIAIQKGNVTRGAAAAAAASAHTSTVNSTSQP